MTHNERWNLDRDNGKLQVIKHYCVLNKMLSLVRFSLTMVLHTVRCSIRAEKCGHFRCGVNHYLCSSSIKALPPTFLCSVVSDVANFDGSNSLLYRLSVWPSWTGKEVISLKFKTLKNSGTLLHAEGQRDHSLTLVLEKGRLLLYHQQGAGITQYSHETKNTYIKNGTSQHTVCNSLHDMIGKDVLTFLGI